MDQLAIKATPPLFFLLPPRIPAHPAVRSFFFGTAECAEKRGGEEICKNLCSFLMGT